MRLLSFLLLVATSHMGLSQQWMTRNGKIEFFSATFVENIEATNEMASGLLAADGRFAFRVPILGFRFEKALMEEHFNENYMESTAYPNGTFEGTIEEWNDALNDGQWHEVKAVGELTVHGVSIQRSIPSKIQWDGVSWQIQSKFSIATAAHDIPIPKMVRNKIAEEIAVEVNLSLSPR